MVALRIFDLFLLELQLLRFLDDLPTLLPDFLQRIVISTPFDLFCGSVDGFGMERGQFYPPVFL